MSPTSSSTKEVVKPETCFDQERHLTSFRLRPDKIPTPGVFIATPSLPFGAIDGQFPVTLVDECRLGANGSKESGGRGLKVVEFKRSGASAKFLSLAIGIPKKVEANNGLRKLMKKSIAEFVKLHDPVKDSTWYQKTFSVLDNGTKVFEATESLSNPENFTDMVLEHDEWDSPSKTFGSFVYGKDEEHTMYINASVDDKYGVRCFDEKMKKMPKKEKQSVVIYPRDGFTLDNVTQLELFLNSDFYKKTHWKTRLMIRISRISFKCEKRGSHLASGNPIYGVYPVFKFKTCSDLCFIETPAVGSGVLDDETLDVAKNMLLYAGLPGPSKKRKRAKKVFGVPDKVEENASDDGRAEDVVAESDGEE